MGHRRSLPYPRLSHIRRVFDKSLGAWTSKKEKDFSSFKPAREFIITTIITHSISSTPRHHIHLYFSCDTPSTCTNTSLQVFAFKSPIPQPYASIFQQPFVTYTIQPGHTRRPTQPAYYIPFSLQIALSPRRVCIQDLVHTYLFGLPTTAKPLQYLFNQHHVLFGTSSSIFSPCNSSAFPLGINFLPLTRTFVGQLHHI